MLNFMAFGLTVKCVQYKCHISVLAFFIFYYVVSKLAFYPFFSDPFRFCPERNAAACSCFSKTIYSSVLAYLCDLSILVCLLCKLYEPGDLFLFTLCIKHYFFLHVYSAPFKTLKCSLLFFHPRAVISSWKAHRPANCTLAKWSCLVILLLRFFLFSVCIPLPSYCSSWSCQAFKCKLFREGLYVLICFFIAAGAL